MHWRPPEVLSEAQGLLIRHRKQSSPRRLHPFRTQAPPTNTGMRSTMQINEAAIKENTLGENHAKRPCAISTARVYRRLG
ncbi:hypothetical protein QQF64_022069 [Cirrhinus molitorella]|uniref:Uncharacterized protein n=1 Tax=Cirrhinus molitorella TaxID=172907 RepID=A0ABR3L748_9TELE